MELKKYWVKFKKFLDRFWDIVWRDDSPKGWLISIIFIFVLIKFIIFPTLSFVTGTQLPLAIVESCSMYHEDNLFSDFDQWWKNHENKYSKFGITKQEFENYLFKKGFNKGDILLILGTEPQDIEVGDVIIFQTNKKTPLIHRVVEINEKDGKRIFSTIGDNNQQMLTPNNNPWGINEKEISEEQILGKAVFRGAPYLGWVKLIFYEPSQPFSNKGPCD